MFYENTVFKKIMGLMQEKDKIKEITSKCANS